MPDRDSRNLGNGFDVIVGYSSSVAHSESREDMWRLQPPPFLLLFGSQCGEAVERPGFVCFGGLHMVLTQALYFAARLASGQSMLVEPE